MKILNSLLKEYPDLIDSVEYEDNSYWLYLKYPYMFDSGISFIHEDTELLVHEKFDLKRVVTGN